MKKGELFTTEKTGGKTSQPKPKPKPKTMNRRVLLLLAAIVAALGAALFAPSSVSAARALLDWEDDLRPR